MRVPASVVPVESSDGPVQAPMWLRIRSWSWAKCLRRSANDSSNAMRRVGTLRSVLVGSEGESVFAMDP